ncbi:MAG TPA: hypothetical protein VFP52_11475 [Myxococcales bacterium]|nr:hypothetical protein [Myxococcales bacterium]
MPVLATLLALLCAAPPAAQPAPPPPPPRHEEASPPLSKDDAELVKHLALLEQLELVRNLDLFDARSDQPPRQEPQRQP